MKTETKTRVVIYNATCTRSGQLVTPMPDDDQYSNDWLIFEGDHEYLLGEIRWHRQQSRQTTGATSSYYDRVADTIQRNLPR